MRLWFWPIYIQLIRFIHFVYSVCLDCQRWFFLFWLKMSSPKNEAPSCTFSAATCSTLNQSITDFHRLPYTGSTSWCDYLQPPSAFIPLAFIFFFFSPRPCSNDTSGGPSSPSSQSSPESSARLWSGYKTQPSSVTGHTEEETRASERASTFG